MTCESKEELNRFDAQVIKREDHIHLDASISQDRETIEQKWVNVRRQKMIFDGEKCLLLSLRDVTSSHMLDKTKKESEMLKKLHMTISKDLVDPLNLITTSAKWLIMWQKEQ